MKLKKTAIWVILKGASEVCWDPAAEETTSKCQREGNGASDTRQS